MLYSERVLEEFYNPQNVGVIKGANGKGKIVSQDTREIMKIFIQVENGVVEDAQFQTFGGVVAIAATSVATRLMIGKTLKQVGKISKEDILKELGGDVPECKMYCIQMAEETVKDSLVSYEKRSKGGKYSTEDDD